MTDVPARRKGANKYEVIRAYAMNAYVRTVIPFPLIAFFRSNVTKCKIYLFYELKNKYF